MKKNSPINELSKGLAKLFWLVLYIYIGGEGKCK